MLTLCACSQPSPYSSPSYTAAPELRTEALGDVATVALGIADATLVE